MCLSMLKDENKVDNDISTLKVRVKNTKQITTEISTVTLPYGGNTMDEMSFSERQRRINRTFSHQVEK